MKTLKEKIEVMQAALDGEKIEVRNKSGVGEWDIMPMPNFESWHCLDYRIKPKPLEFWVNIKNKELCKGGGFDTRLCAYSNSCQDCTQIKVREVLDENI